MAPDAGDRAAAADDDDDDDGVWGLEGGDAGADVIEEDI